MSTVQPQFQPQSQIKPQKSFFRGRNFFIGALIAIPSYCFFKKQYQSYSQNYQIDQNYSIKGGKLIYQDFRGNQQQIENKLSHIKNDLQTINYPGSREISIIHTNNNSQNVDKKNSRREHFFNRRHGQEKDSKDNNDYWNEQLEKFGKLDKRRYKYVRNNSQVGILLEEGQYDEQQLKEFIEKNPSYKISEIQDFKGYKTQWNNNAYFTNVNQPFKNINRFIGGLDHLTFEKQNIKITVKQDQQDSIDCIIPNLEENNKFPVFKE